MPRQDDPHDSTECDPLGRELFWAYLHVTSKVMRLPDISAALGLEPDKSVDSVQPHDIGDLNPKGIEYRWASWLMKLKLDDSISKSTEGLEEAIESLDDELADKLAGLGEMGCAVSIQLVQEFIFDEDNDTGIFLSPGAIRWMSRAGAFLDIDQYLWQTRG